MDQEIVELSKIMQSDGADDHVHLLREDHSGSEEDEEDDDEDEEEED